MTGSDEAPGYRQSRQSADESSLIFPAGASKGERVAIRLESIEKNGRLVIGRASSGAYTGRLIGSVALGLLGLLVLVLGADGFVALCAVVHLILFGLVSPMLIVRRHQQDYRLELTPESLELIRDGQSGEETVHHATWSVVDSVTTASFGNRPESPSFPAVNVAFASGSGRRSTRRSFLTREIQGERIVLNQPLEVGRWELVDLLTAAHERFRPKPDPAR